MGDLKTTWVCPPSPKYVDEEFQGTCKARLISRTRLTHKEAIAEEFKTLSLLSGPHNINQGPKNARELGKSCYKTLEFAASSFLDGESITSEYWRTELEDEVSSVTQ